MHIHARKKWSEHDLRMIWRLLKTISGSSNILCLLGVLVCCSVGGLVSEAFFYFQIEMMNGVSPQSLSNQPHKNKKKRASAISLWIPVYHVCPLIWNNLLFEKMHIYIYIDTWSNYVYIYIYSSFFFAPKKKPLAPWNLPPHLCSVWKVFGFK